MALPPGVKLLLLGGTKTAVKMKTLPNLKTRSELLLPVKKNAKSVGNRSRVPSGVLLDQRQPLLLMMKKRQGRQIRKNLAIEKCIWT